MSAIDLHRVDVQAALSVGSVTPADLVRASVDRIHATEALSAWTYVDEAGALEAAASSPTGALAGVTVGVKDSIAVAGMPFEAGSDVFRGAVARHDSAVVAGLRGQGAIPLGMTTMHALGLGDAVRFGHRTTAHHPWHVDYVPSGSSSGAAVATAARACAVAIGGDTGGSVRGPAASCGVLGLKPTAGRIDAAGTTPMAWSMDTVGLFARDLDLLWQVCSVLELVPDSLPEPRPYRIGIVPAAELSGLSAEMEDMYAGAARLLAAAGHEVVSVAAPDLDTAPPAWLARMAEFRAVLARVMTTAPERVPESMKRVYAASEAVTHRDYRESWVTGSRLAEQVDAALSDVDVLLLPATPTRTLTWSDWTGSGLAGSDVSGWYRYLLPFNVTGHPAVSVPWELLEGGVPASVQLVARHDAEGTLLAVTREVRHLAPWPDAMPTRVAAMVASHATTEREE